MDPRVRLGVVAGALGALDAGHQPERAFAGEAGFDRDHVMRVAAERRLGQIEHVAVLDVGRRLARRHRPLEMPLADNLLRGLHLQGGHGDAGDEQCARRVELAIPIELPGLQAQRRQLEPCVDVRPALAHLVGQVVGTVAVVAHHQLVALGLFQLGDVAALQVLDDLRLEDLAGGERAHQRRNGGEACEQRCAVAALAGDDLVQRTRVAPLGRGVVVGPQPGEDRLHHALLADRCGQILKVGEGLARVGGAGRECVQRDLGVGGDGVRFHGGPQ